MFAVGPGDERPSTRAGAGSAASWSQVQSNRNDFSRFGQPQSRGVVDPAEGRSAPEGGSPPPDALEPQARLQACKLR